jgi:hypothetical protein
MAHAIIASTRLPDAVVAPRVGSTPPQEGFLMRPRVRAAACVLVAVAAGCGSESSDKAGGRAERARGATLELHGRQDGFAPSFNTKGKQFVPGDQYAYTNKLTDGSGRRMGDEDVFCALGPRKDVHACVATLRLPKGQLSAQGVIEANGTGGTLAIVGGTGEYEGARGTLTTTGPTRTGESIVIHLL